MQAYITERASDRLYYGNAEPEGETVVLGGDEFVVGGWVDYQLEKRRHDHSSGGSEGIYDGRETITGQDVLESLFRDPNDVLAVSSAYFADALDIYEAAAGKSGVAHSVVVIPSLVAEDVRAAPRLTDMGELHRLAREAEPLMTNYHHDPHPVYAAPSASQSAAMSLAISTSDAKAVRSLEAAVAPVAQAVERYRGHVAAVFGRSAEAVRKVVNSSID